MNRCQLGYGRFPEDEDMIIGTKESLNYLINLCEKAIEEGESYSELECEIYGVKKVDKDYFEKEEKESFKNKVLSMVFALFFLSSLIVGVVTMIRWIISCFSV